MVVLNGDIKTVSSSTVSQCNVRLPGQKHLDHLHVTLTCRQVKWSGLRRVKWILDTTKFAESPYIRSYFNLSIKATSPQLPLFFVPADSLYIYSYFNHSTTVTSQQRQRPLTKTHPSEYQNNHSTTASSLTTDEQCITCKTPFFNCERSPNFIYRAHCWSRLFLPSFCFIPKTGSYYPHLLSTLKSHACWSIEVYCKISLVQSTLPRLGSAM